jgi:hypothetical protein
MTTAAITPARLAQLLDVDLRTVQRFVERGLLPKPEHRNPVAWNDPTKLAAALLALDLKRGARMAKIAAVQMLEGVW